MKTIDPIPQSNMSESKKKRKRKEKSKSGDSLGDVNSIAGSSSGRHLTNNALPRSRSDKEYSDPSRKRKRSKKGKSDRSSRGVYSNYASSPDRHSGSNGEPNKKRKRKKKSKDDCSSGRFHSIGASTRHSTRDDMIELNESVFYSEKVVLHKKEKYTRRGVYKGEQRNGEGMSSIPLAIKILLIKDSAQLERYRRALNNIFKLQNKQDCRYLVELKHFKMDISSLYIAMPLHHVITLADINLEKVCQDQLRNLFLHIGRALKDLLRTDEGRKVLANMNLKPSKFLFSINGRNVRISDLGLSTAAQGWRPAELLDRRPAELLDPKQLEKWFVFILGLLGSYILYNKHHPFAAAGDKTNPALWEENIKKRKSPNLEPLKDDHLERDLFMKMLSHDPDKRPSIDEVLRHCMFWSLTKKVNFINDILENYAFKTGCGKQIVYHFNKRTKTLDMASKPLTTYFKNAGEKDIMNEIKAVISECWLDGVENMDKRKGTKVYKKFDRENYPNSFTGLLRYIRNESTHALKDKQEFCQYWFELFPTLLPYLLRIIKPHLTEEDRKEYVEKSADTVDIDVSHLLGEMP